MDAHTLIITEKPDAAKRIAFALDANGTPIIKYEKGGSYYIAKRKFLITIVPALGHLYTVTIHKKNKKSYPVFNYRWSPKYLTERKAGKIRDRIELISKLSKKIDRFIDACDSDIEGSIIGYTILKYACGNKEKLAHRMKYSTLTKEDILKAYNELSPSLDFAIIKAGITRHEIDWLYGINLSRALTAIAKKYSGRYTNLSTGRVQGPTLNFIKLREIERKKFIPKNYWQIKAKIKIEKSIFLAQYRKKFLKKKSDEIDIIDNCRGINCVIQKFEKKKYRMMPPTPFYLGSLQMEAYKLFKITPEQTLKILQGLYLATLISYPRTSSQKLPASIGYRKIIQRLQKNSEYNKLASEILTKKILKPNEGTKIDPAHPAIYPTGNNPNKVLKTNERKILDLIVKRFLAVFCDYAIREKTKITINIDNYLFFIIGNQSLDWGWIKFYRPYFKLENKIIPTVKENQKVSFIKLISEEKTTNPPVRFNPSSLLRKMEKEKIGTKTTRSGIIKTLEKRKYIIGEKISITELGNEVIEILKDYCSSLVSVELTRNMEVRMKDIIQGKEKKETIIRDTIELIKKTIRSLSDNEEIIGTRLKRVIQKGMFRR